MKRSSFGIHAPALGSYRPVVLFVFCLVLLVSGCAVMRAIRTRIPKPHPTPTGVIFQYEAPAARQVNLAGSFNNWGGTQGGGRFDPNIDPMSSDEKGIWSIYVPLPPGRYQYKFVVDQVRWEKDPNNPDIENETGYQNTFLVVPEGIKYDVPYLSLAASLENAGTRAAPKGSEVEFTLSAPDAKSVYLAGDFNNWAGDKDGMKKGQDGIWRIKIAIPAGKHEYKFVVDGQWNVDPDNPNKVADPYGGFNSVIDVSE
ncbi:MAG: glycogen-binding domain-containing protein [Candidatus Eisenbacteria bacterium]|nr:glycogen-binding domain-containing protein [Candidatus Eisenbacteria bacterium]